VTEGPEEIWMSQQVNASAQDDAEEQYYVLHDNQESELMTLDELDTAFQEERIHEETLVCRVGDTKWLKLRELANLDEEEAEQAAPEAPAPVPQPVAQPFAPAYAAPAQPRAAYVAPAQPQAAYVPPSVPPARTQPAVAPYQASSTPSAAYQPMTLSAPASMSPMAFDLDDLDAAALRPKRRVGLIAAGIGVLAVGGIAAVSLAGSADKIAPTVAVPTAAVAAAALSPSTLDTLKTATPAPVAAPTPPPAAEEEPKAATGRLTDDMKAALLAQDKERDSKRKTRTAAAAPRRSGKAGKSGGPFKAGGSAYDPLNGKL
jgi:hypothetical protein